MRTLLSRSIPAWIFVVAPFACTGSPAPERAREAEAPLIGAAGATRPSVVHVRGCTDGDVQDCFGDGAKAKGVTKWNGTGIAFGKQCLMTATHIWTGTFGGKGQVRLFAYVHTDAERNTDGLWVVKEKGAKNFVTGLVHKFGEVANPPKGDEGQPEIVILKMKDAWDKTVADKGVLFASDLAERLPGKDDYVMAFGFGWDNVPGKEKQQSEGYVTLATAPAGESKTTFLTGAREAEGAIKEGVAAGDSGGPSFLLKKVRDGVYKPVGVAGVLSSGNATGVGTHASTTAAFGSLTAKERAAIAKECDWTDDAASSTSATTGGSTSSGVPSSSGGGTGGGDPGIGGAAPGAGGWSFGGGGWGFGDGPTSGSGGSGTSGGGGGLGGAGGARASGASSGGGATSSGGGASSTTNSSSSGTSGGGGAVPVKVVF